MSEAARRGGDIRSTLREREGESGRESVAVRESAMKYVRFYFLLLRELCALICLCVCALSERERESGSERGHILCNLQ